MRAIDHLVLPVTTLASGRSRLTGLGFTVAPDARHPFGTGNCCVFLADRTYLEPITILDRDAADQAAAEGLFFVRRLKRYTERRGEGFAMLALQSADIEADHAAFEQMGVSAGPPFRFTRPAVLPDGAEREIGVALAYAEDRAAPDATLFACQRIAADVLFQPAFLEHPNGAVGLSTVPAVADEPARFAAFMAALTGGQPNETAEGLDAGGTVLVLTPDAYSARFGVAPPEPRGGLLLAAFEVLVADLDRAVGYAGPTATRHNGNIVVPPGPGLGATLAFTARDQDGRTEPTA